MTIVGVAAGLVGGSALAKNYPVSEIRPLSEIKCNFRNNGSTEQCSDFNPPIKVAVGESFSAEGLRRVIRFVVATPTGENAADTLSRQWSCVAAETRDDLGQGQPHRIWLLIPRCVPLL